MVTQIDEPVFTGLPWQNEFQKPTLEALTEPYDKTNGGFFDALREHILSFEGVTEEIEWHGLPWRWCMVYRHPGDEERPAMYLVPHPKFPILSIPMSYEMVCALPMRRLRKFVRDEINPKRCIGTTYWASWEVSNNPQLDDTKDIAKRKLNFLSKALA